MKSRFRERKSSFVFVCCDRQVTVERSSLRTYKPQIARNIPFLSSLNCVSRKVIVSSQGKVLKFSRARSRIKLMWKFACIVVISAPYGRFMYFGAF